MRLAGPSTRKNFSGSSGPFDVASRRVRFAATAQRHVQREKAWWLENRTHTDVFATEPEAALRVLALLPGAGSLYTQAGIPGVRRLYLPKLACHLYDTFDDDEVIVRAFWGTRRGRRPRIER